MSTSGCWLSRPQPGAETVACAAWLTEPDRPTGQGVLVLPPVGYEYSSSHRLWRTVAEQLAGVGSTVLRLDYAGTGDSAGHAAGITGLGAWRESVRLGADALRARGCSSLVLLGAQLGATLALIDAADLAPAGIVTVAPVLSGRRFVRGLSVIGIRSPGGGGGIAHGGGYFTDELLAEISATSVAAPQDLPYLELTDHPGVRAVLQRPAEESEVDEELVAQIVDWIATVPAGDPGSGRVDASVVASTSVALNGCTEEFVSLGPDALVGVLTTPGGADADIVYVLINSGSDPHVGPGRAWVELARHLAARGMTTLRIDLRGWGESPGGPSVPGRPYDEHCVADVVGAVRALRAQGRRRIVLGGLCAGAWVALAVARSPENDADGCVVLNPQLYWQPGDPVEALLTTTRARRTAEIEQIKDGALSGRWDLEDELGARPPAARWLDELVALRRPIAMLFAAGDDGIEYLRDRFERRLTAAVDSGVVRVVELSDVDHAMQRVWFRPAVFEAVADQLRWIAGSTAVVDQGVPERSG